jgi:hypothetical protein
MWMFAEKTPAPLWRQRWWLWNRYKGDAIDGRDQFQPMFDGAKLFTA